MNTQTFFSGLAMAACLSGVSGPVLASNISNSPNSAHAYGANVGWIYWRPGTSDGATVYASYLTGDIWSANCGWIRLGSGSPGNGYRYLNNGAADFGVNLNQDGTLSGYAYGANIGWIHFTDQTAAGPLSDSDVPRVDLKTGRFQGYAYSANCGWISLSTGVGFVKATSLEAGPDTDGDQIPDAWEKQMTGGLGQLSQNGDLDGDGYSDLEEYQADTDPTDPLDLLRITDIAAQGKGAVVDLTWTSKPSRCYRVETRDSLFEGVWQPLDPDQLYAPAAGDSTTGKVVQPAGDQKFYRIQSVLPGGQFGP